MRAFEVHGILSLAFVIFISLEAVNRLKVECSVVISMDVESVVFCSHKLKILEHMKRKMNENCLARNWKSHIVKLLHVSDIPTAATSTNHESRPLSLRASTGMHRKSMEAAEALKDDSGGSDRDDEHSKASDISSPGNPSNKSTPTARSKCAKANNSLASPSPSTTSNPEHGHHTSITLVSTTTSSSQMTSSPNNNNNNTSSASAPHTPLPVHHLLESKSMLPSPNHPTFHHDNDTEAFRWVGDPISFIRCEHIWFIKYFISPAAGFRSSWRTFSDSFRQLPCINWNYAIVFTTETTRLHACVPRRKSTKPVCSTAAYCCRFARWLAYKIRLPTRRRTHTTIMPMRCTRAMHHRYRHTRRTTHRPRRRRCRTRARSIIWPITIHRPTWVQRRRLRASIRPALIWLFDTKPHERTMHIFIACHVDAPSVTDAIAIRLLNQKRHTHTHTNTEKRRFRFVCQIEHFYYQTI